MLLLVRGTSLATLRLRVVVTREVTVAEAMAMKRALLVGAPLGSCPGAAGLSHLPDEPYGCTGDYDAARESTATRRAMLPGPQLHDGWRAPAFAASRATAPSMKPAQRPGFVDRNLHHRWLWLRCRLPLRCRQRRVDLRPGQAVRDGRRAVGPQRQGRAFPSAGKGGVAAGAAGVPHGGGLAGLTSVAGASSGNGGTSGTLPAGGTTPSWAVPGVAGSSPDPLPMAGPWPSPGRVDGRSGRPALDSPRLAMGDHPALAGESSGVGGMAEIEPQGGSDAGGAPGEGGEAGAFPGGASGAGQVARPASLALLALLGRRPSSLLHQPEVRRAFGLGRRIAGCAGPGAYQLEEGSSQSAQPWRAPGGSLCSAAGGDSGSRCRRPQVGRSLEADPKRSSSLGRGDQLPRNVLWPDHALLVFVHQREDGPAMESSRSRGTG